MGKNFHDNGLADRGFDIPLPPKNDKYHNRNLELLEQGASPQEFLLANLGMVEKFAQRMSGRREWLFESYFQDGCAGFLRAFRRWDKEKEEWIERRWDPSKARLGTFVHPWMINESQMRTSSKEAQNVAIPHSHYQNGTYEELEMVYLDSNRGGWETSRSEEDYSDIFGQEDENLIGAEANEASRQILATLISKLELNDLDTRVLDIHLKHERPGRRMQEAGDAWEEASGTSRANYYRRRRLLFERMKELIESGEVEGI